MDMRKRSKFLTPFILLLVVIFALTSLGNSVGSAQADELPPIASGDTSTEYLTVNTITAVDGSLLTETIIHGP
ncbi:MAG: hypothetical protein ABIJ65_03605, partial [Chloroflexota bacterium]